MYVSDLAMLCVKKINHKIETGLILKFHNKQTYIFITKVKHFSHLTREIYSIQIICCKKSAKVERSIKRSQEKVAGKIFLYSIPNNWNSSINPFNYIKRPRMRIQVLINLLCTLANGNLCLNYSQKVNKEESPQTPSKQYEAKYHLYHIPYEHSCACVYV